MNGFELQRDQYGCGAYALAHAMLLLGKPMSIEESKKRCKTISYWDSVKRTLGKIEIIDPSAEKWLKLISKFFEDTGTSEFGIMSAIRKLQCSPLPFESASEIIAQKWLKTQLRNGYPVISLFNFDQTIDDSGHWITFGGRLSQNEFIIIDSSPFDNTIIDFYSWKDLIKRFLWIIKDDKQFFQFYGIAIKPKQNNIKLHSMVHRFHTVVEKIRKKSELLDYWGYYVGDVSEIFGYGDGISAEKLLKKFQASIIDSITYWSGSDNKPNLNYLFEIYLLICKAYDIRVCKDRIEDILIDFTAAFDNESIFY